MMKKDYWGPVIPGTTVTIEFENLETVTGVLMLIKEECRWVLVQLDSSYQPAGTPTLGNVPSPISEDWMERLGLKGLTASDKPTQEAPQKTGSIWAQLQPVIRRTFEAWGKSGEWYLLDHHDKITQMRAIDPSSLDPNNLGGSSLESTDQEESDDE